MDIYQRIWNADQQGNGIRPVLQEAEGDPDHGFVVVDELGQGETHRLFPKVQIPDAKRSTYELCHKLFNNYRLDKTKREVKTPEEDQEVFALLDTIFDSPPMQVAREYVEGQTAETWDQQRWTSTLIDIWFRQFDMGSGRDLSGFEHIIVGEQDHGKVSGYHFWYKYHLDDSADFLDRDDVFFVGPRYDGPNAASGPLTELGVNTPDVSTLAYRWEAFDYDTGERRPLYKPIGGFWNGLSIEGLLALGTVRFIPAARSPKETVINGVLYGLKLYRSDDGHSLRTFYPELLGSAQPRPEPAPTPEPGPTPGPQPTPTPAAQAAVRIIAALVNPEGNDEGLETITLINVAPEAIELGGWAIRDRNGNSFTLPTQHLPAGTTHTVTLPRNTAQLGNRGGLIELLDADGQVVHTVEYSRADADRSGWTLLF